VSDSQPLILIVTSARFPLGNLVATPGALESIPNSEIQAALNRHIVGDWGNLDPHDVRVNESALAHGGRLFSAYTSAQGERFYIITEADSSATTILLPEEY